MKKVYSLIVKLNSLLFKYRSLISFSIVLIGVFLSDLLFHFYFPSIVDFLEKQFGILLEDHKQLDLGFAPEIWGGVLAMVLGTLIIVIAIAAESSPKLMDLFVKDWLSLTYVWFLIIASLHAIVIMVYWDPLSRVSSVILNTYVYLFLGSVLSLPYIFYILLYSKTSNVVVTISNIIKEFIVKLQKTGIKSAIQQNKQVVEEYQKEMMGSLDQLDDLLAFTEFKETQTEIIHEISELIQKYIREKPDFNEQFFKLTSVIRNNATYRTYTEQQYQEMEGAGTFFEIKTFRLLGNSYIKMIENDRFDIASLIPAEMIDVGKTCIDMDDNKNINNVNIRFNTLFRFAVKHAYKNNEPRNLYNLAFHYSNMVQAYILAGRVDLVKYCYDKFKFYANDIYKNASQNPSLYFIVDTLTFELKKCQVLIHEQNWSNEDQLFLLNIILQLDAPPGFSKDSVDKGILGGNNGTRRIQIGLALFYLSVSKPEFAKAIAEDYLDDLDYFDEKTFRQNVNTQCFLLSIFTAEFWEDTDRGNINIYFAQEKEMIEPFKELLFGLLDKKIEELEFDVQFLSLEMDKLMQKRQKQDGYLNEDDKNRLEDLQRKINAREKPDEELDITWNVDHDVLYTMLCIAFFADQEIDDIEKTVIFESFIRFVDNIDENSFNEHLNVATSRFIDLKNEDSRQNQFEKSLIEIQNKPGSDEKYLNELINTFIEIANADDFIHENEIMLINIAIDLWKLKITINKPKKNQKLEIESN
tara:strand:+ start:171 stop:2426 length:2256 start_codon:yes stop_codon:yes gene_type:complete